MVVNFMRIYLIILCKGNRFIGYAVKGRFLSLVQSLSPPSYSAPTPTNKESTQRERAPRISEKTRLQKLHKGNCKYIHAEKRRQDHKFHLGHNNSSFLGIRLAYM